ncbi:MAG: UDP-N-acetylmuramoyl-tripeptide--D-alanyl-D-alanine ligase [Candidatus Parcubacteria bacterium]|jgi:UDP-N-acetylmuramoyl-tripeptide--D-alanyl-D-alanine ligase
MVVQQIVQRFLASAARRAIRRERPQVIAVTGSLGKSSVKEAIGVALGAREAGSSVRMSLKNYNNEYGVPLTIIGTQTPCRNVVMWVQVLFRALWLGWGMGKIGAKVLVLEMGADRKGDLAWLVGIAPPDVAVVTSVSPAHAEFFGSVEEIAIEKGTLVRALSKRGVAILNADDPRVTAMRKETEATVRYVGESEGSDVRIHDVRIAMDMVEDERNVPRGVEVALDVHGQMFRTELRGTIGRPQAFAAAVAVAVAPSAGVPVEQALERLNRDYHGIAGRTRIIPGIKFTTLIDDSYNAASPTAMISGLRDVASMELSSGTQRRIAALGDMRELGSYSDEAHRAVGHEVATLGFDVLVTCGTLARDIAAAAREAGMADEAIHSFDDVAAAGLFIQGLIAKGDVIFIKGSQGSRTEKIVKELMAEPLQAPFLLVRMTKEWLDRP